MAAIDLAKRALLRRAAGGAGLSLLGAWALAQPAQHSVRIVAKKFEFTPERISLQLGQPVVVELTSLDVPMGFAAHELGLRGDMLPGRVTTLRFTPDKLGSFTFRCDIFCGAGHEEMSGTIEVVGS